MIESLQQIIEETEKRHTKERIVLASKELNELYPHLSLFDQTIQSKTKKDKYVSRQNLANYAFDPEENFSDQDVDQPIDYKM